MALSRPITLPAIISQNIHAETATSGSLQASACSLPTASAAQLPNVSQISFSAPKSTQRTSPDASVLMGAPAFAQTLLPVRMDRALKTIVDAWREYDEGLPGKPSIRVLYESETHTFSSTTAGNTERRWFDRRKCLYHAVRTIAEHRSITSMEAAMQLDAWRCRLKNCSINHAQDEIRRLTDDEIKLL